MIKIAAFSCREDEFDLFRYFEGKMGIEVVLSPEKPTLANAGFVEGCQAVSVITTAISGELIEAWSRYGVKVISTRTVGYEHIDYRSAAKLGITVSNVSYSPDTVAEYAVMSILMAIRKMKTIMMRSMVQDYSLSQLRGREIRKMTVGVIGTGKIGETVIRDLSGFGCRLLAYDLYEKESVKQSAQYVPLEQIFTDCDVITMHTPATEDTYHLINAATISRMKDGVIIINTARGTLIDTGALIHALEAGKIGAAVLDVVEHETGIYYTDFKYTPVRHHEIAILSAMPNVVMTPHTAFFTDEAVSDMIEFSLSSCINTIQGKSNPWKVNI